MSHVTTFCTRCGTPDNLAHEATLLKQENTRLRLVLGIECRRGHIPADAVYSPEDIHLAMPVRPAYDDLGNLRLES
jgi:hypothetical protein